MIRSMTSSLAVSSPRSHRTAALAAAVSLLALAATRGAADGAGRGKILFAQNCAVCHASGLEPAGQAAGGVGGSLAGIFGRPAGSRAGFNSTPALAASKLTWNSATLDGFLANPSGLVPGTSMLATVPSAGDRSAIIAFLATLPAPRAAAAKVTVDAAAVAATADNPSDWRRTRPGLPHHLRAADLPAPFHTTSASYGPRVIAPPPGAQVAVPPGFTAEKFATGLTGPRLLRVAPNGDIFVAETRENRVRVLRPSADGKTAAESRLYAEGLDRPFGVAFYPADRPEWVYVANNNSVVRFAYQAGDLKARGAAQVIVPQLSESRGGHSTRDLAFSLDGKRLFIAVGSASNVAQDAPAKTAAEIRQWEAEHGRGAAWGNETNRALILVTDPEGRTGLRSFATGIRNGVGIAVDPATGELWTSTNERDGLGDDLVPDYITRVKEGGFYGWPWYYLGRNEDPRHPGKRPDLAGAAIVPDILVQAHSASLQMTFYTAKSGAGLFPPEYHGDVFAALHGSWNRNSRTGYKVIRVHLTHGVPDGSYEDFLTGFVANPDEVWGRPVGVAVAQDGALLVTEDGNGTIWRVAYTGK